MAHFRPTAESIPPQALDYRLRAAEDRPVHYHALNPLAFLLHSAKVYPNKVAIVHADVEYPVYYTYAVWAQRVQNLAYALIQAGIQPGDRVAVLAPNSPASADAHHGVLAARAVLCPINIRLTAAEIDYILSHSGSKVLIVDHEYVHLVKGTKATVIVTNDTGRSGDPYEEFLCNGRRFSAETGWKGLEWEPNEDAACVLCYTSGTTGRPKGVVTTLRGSYLCALANVLEPELNRDSIYLWILPMFHASGWTYPWAITAAAATQITLRTVSYPLIWKHLLKSGVTHYCAAPTVQIGIVNAQEAQRIPHPVTAIVAGSAPTAHLIGELEKKGIRPIHVYGLTEVSGTFGPFAHSYEQYEWKTFTLEERAKLIARQGMEYVVAEDIRVVYPAKEGDDINAELVDVPKDGKTIGEIVTRGNTTMKEYFQDPKATRKAFQGGYFHTGDLAVMHPDGSVAIQDRSKDIIISGGENVSSLAIEQELATHPDVLEVSVVARPHPKWGERAMAFILLHADAVKRRSGQYAAFEVELKKHARERLPGFACPEWIMVVDELPKTSTGKIQKMMLRQIVAKL